MMTLAMEDAARARIGPAAGPARGAVRLPGSKSMTNRALLLAGLADGASRLEGALESDDTRHMRTALQAMGVAVERPGPGLFAVASAGRLRAPAAPLFLGNAGTATRFLTAAAATVRGRTVIDGDAHMRKRPIAPLLDALRAQGIRCDSPTGAPPVAVESDGALEGGVIAVDAGLSSQYVSALMMVAPLAKAPVELRLVGLAPGAPLPAQGYVELTASAMRAFGIAPERVGDLSWRIAPGRYRGRDYVVEPDASAATYFWALEALTGGALDIGLDAAACAQPDARAKDVIATFPNLPAVVDGAQMQDSVPTLAVLAAFANEPVRFEGLANLRVKECDRIRALSLGLNALAPDAAEEIGDDLVVRPEALVRSAPRPALIDSFEDHRIAMSFALAGVMREGVAIDRPWCVAKTFPAYWERLRALGIEIAFEA